MASLKDARAFAEELHSLSGRLQSELEKGSADFRKLVELSDEIGESADRLAATFNAINGSLTGLIEDRGPDEGQDGGSGDGESDETGTRSRSRRRRSGGAGGRGGPRRRQKGREG